MHRDSVKGSKPCDVELSIIIVNFNTREMIVECLRSIEAQTHDTSYEIVAVDNMSTDGSADVIRCKFPNVSSWHQRQIWASREPIIWRSRMLEGDEFCS